MRKEESMGKEFGPISAGRVQWQLRRGMLELDLMLNAFFDQCYPYLTAEEKEAFIQILEMPDPLLHELLQADMFPPAHEMLPTNVLQSGASVNAESVTSTSGIDKGNKEGDKDNFGITKDNADKNRDNQGIGKSNNNESININNTQSETSISPLVLHPEVPKLIKMIRAAGELKMKSRY